MNDLFAPPHRLHDRLQLGSDIRYYRPQRINAQFPKRHLVRSRKDVVSTVKEGRTINRRDRRVKSLARVQRLIP
jgi:hypothetical protein